MRLLNFLLPVAFLLVGAAGQKYYYIGTTTDTITDTEFYLVTRRENVSYYVVNDYWQFNARSTSVAFLIEIMDFNVDSASLLVESDKYTIFAASQIKSQEMAMTTPTKFLTVTFSPSGDRSTRRGVTLRVRVLDQNGCPPGWTYKDKTACIGSAVEVTSKLSFSESQLACNKMRSNLLQVPANNIGNIQEYLGTLPKSLTMENTWVGLTDRDNMGSPYWLNGLWQKYTSEISCLSGGSYSECSSMERCATQKLTANSSYAIYMEICDNSHNYICAMPPTGTDTFYPIPRIRDPTTGPATTATDSKSTATTTATGSKSTATTTATGSKSTATTTAKDSKSTATTTAKDSKSTTTTTQSYQTTQTKDPQTDFSRTAQPTTVVSSTTRVQPKIAAEAAWYLPLLIFATTSVVIFWVAVLGFMFKFLYSLYVLKSAASGKRASHASANRLSFEQGILQFSGPINDTTS